MALLKEYEGRQQQSTDITNQREDLVFTGHLCSFTQAKGGLTTGWLTRVGSDSKESSRETDILAWMELLLCTGALKGHVCGFNYCVLIKIFLHRATCVISTLASE